MLSKEAKLPPLGTIKRTPRCLYYQKLLDERPMPVFPMRRLSAVDFEYAEVLSAGFDIPFVVDGYSDAFGLFLPFGKDMDHIAQQVGPDTPVRLIDVAEQDEVTGYSLQAYADFLLSRPRGKIFNMISLEFSGTDLSNEVNGPSFVSRIDWVRCLWPLSRLAKADYPRVQKYCLAGMAGSYTDFHIDFGGTSVWYHLLRGAKRFLLIAPTTANLLTYQAWTASHHQDEVFLGDLLPGQVFTFDLLPGQTLCLPSGWIHAVYTPADCIVFGGNFLHSYSILRQLQSHAIELATKIDIDYRFPHFVIIHWYFLTELLMVAKEIHCPKGEEEEQEGGGAGSKVSQEDDDGNITQQIAHHLCRPAVLRQLPLLVKACEGWLADAAPAELRVMVSAAAQCLRTPEEVLVEWWELLEQLSARLGQGLPEAVQSVKELQKMDVFQETLVNTALPAFADDLAALLNAVPVPQSAALAANAPTAAKARRGVKGAQMTKLLAHEDIHFTSSEGEEGAEEEAVEDMWADDDSDDSFRRDKVKSKAKGDRKAALTPASAAKPVVGQKRKAAAVAGSGGAVSKTKGLSVRESIMKKCSSKGRR